METEQLFQEKPKDTEACTLVKDSHDTKRVRDYMKKRILKQLDIKPEDFDIEESDIKWSAIQRFTETPAMINLRLKSYHKGMTLVAYNSFEVYHGCCRVTGMRIRNDLADEKLDEHVDNAVKTFKGQAKFNELEAAKYKKTHSAILKKEKIISEQLQKQFAKLGIVPDENDLVEVFNYYGENGRKSIQMLQLARCNYFVFAEQHLKKATEATDDVPDGVDINCNYHMSSDMWFVTVNDLLSSDATALFGKNLKVVKLSYKSERGKKIVSFHRSSLKIGDNNESVPKKDLKYNRSTRVTLTISTEALSKLLKQYKLKIWKIRQD